MIQERTMRTAFRGQCHSAGRSRVRLERSGDHVKSSGPFLLAALVTLMVVAPAWLPRAQAEGSPYPRMAPLDQYLMARDAEIALARSAAPKSISQDAEVLVLERQGYKTAVKGKNGFVCIVQRSWTADRGDPEFWNPKLRAPICFNAPAARSYLPITLKKTDWVLAGRSQEQVFEGVKAAFEKKELPALEPGAMCYMMSRQGYLNDRAGPWRPHLMIFVPETEPATWGAGLPDAPLIASKDESARLTVFMIPVGKWSDGSDASTTGDSGHKKDQP
jgi:hypothetical protein